LIESYVDLQEVIQQLQLMGEVVYLKTEAADLICLCPKWLCSTLCGYLLSRSSGHDQSVSWLKCATVIIDEENI
jgi:hypothetical protein